MIIPSHGDHKSKDEAMVVAAGSKILISNWKIKQSFPAVEVGLKSSQNIFFLVV
jgi:hypothetical protein